MELFTAAKSYDFSEVQLVIGALRIAGFGDDGGISIEPTGPVAAMAQGCDGEVTVSKKPLPPHTVTITLKETSASNAVLEGLLVAQRAAPDGFVLPFAMLDATTNEAVLAGQCVFLELPTIGKAAEAGTREWKLGLPYVTSIFAS